MPRYQLEASIPLVVAGACSLIICLLSDRSSKASVQLPVHDDDDFNRTDPFNVVKPEDVVDGHPIDGDAFWKKVRLRKIAAVLITAIILVSVCVCLGWSVMTNDHQGIAIYSLHIAFSLYILVLGGLAVAQNETSMHGYYVLHLTIITLIASLALGSVTVLPSTAFVRTMAEISDFSVADILWITSVVLYILLCFIYITTPLGPPFSYPANQIYSEKTVEAITNDDPENVSGEAGGSLLDRLLFSYTTKVVHLGNVAATLETGDLPIVAADMRATYNFAAIRTAMRKIKPRWLWWKFKPGSGWGLLYRLVKVNQVAMFTVFALAAVSAVAFYVPPFFLQRVVSYLESDPERLDRRWGFVFTLGLFASWTAMVLITGQLWSLSTTTVQVRLRIQMNTLLFSKTLVRKDVASSAPALESGEGEEDEESFSSKAQVMTLMTTDVDRTAEFGWHMFALIDAPIEIAVGSLFLYKLIGVSAFVGLAVTVLFMPINHYAGKVVVRAQDHLMKARDERVALMNEILGGIRMLKFMAWERSFEKRVLAIRVKELKYQKLNYTIETLWNGTWNALPVFVTLISFWHFTYIRGNVLKPSTAFAALSVFSELKFALSALPETFINMLQTFVSLRRIEKYLMGAEVKPIPPLREQSQVIAFQGATATWPQDRSIGSQASSVASTPRQKFVLVDLNLNFPIGEMSLICGKLGSGKTLLLLALLGEVDVLTGQIMCPRSPPHSLASFADILPKDEDWIVQGMCAYVPQAAWLRNASIRDNILFNLPYNESRYQRTLEACALITDLQILEDGDESEIGERGVNLSGGQKARVSLARAVYSRASVLLLDDVLSAVDAHTAHHLYNFCLKGEIMQGRTIILVSHHVQLCAPGAKFIVALDNGRVDFSGNYDTFQASSVMKGLIQSTATETVDDKEEQVIEEIVKEETHESRSSTDGEIGPESSSASTIAANGVVSDPLTKKKPRKLIEEEKRAVGRIQRAVWETYFWACGGRWYWFFFIFTMLVAALTPVLENGWLKIWSGTSEQPVADKGPLYYIIIYAIITTLGLIITTLRWFVLYRGSIHASIVLYQKLLETVLFANIRFHDTISRGRLLNRFGKDFEGIDSSLADNFGRSVINGLSVFVTIITITWVGGPVFFAAFCLLGVLYWNAAKVYGQTSRDMRRLDSVTRSPLYNTYGETISGVTIIRAFGASSKFLRDMICCVDTNANSYYWMWGVNRWLSIRFNLLSSAVVGVVALGAVLTPGISASLAGFTLTFASSITNDLLFLVRRFVGLEQSMVALERVKEFSELKREPPEFIEPRPHTSWPSEGHIQCENLAIRYAPDLPNVLHNINFEVKAGEKIGILGRTGSGKSTLALSFFRFVEATEGSILVDGIDISKIGLTDLRSKLTIIPQDPTVLSGTLRSTLDVFDEYEDAEIFEALRRVHLIPSEETPEEALDTINSNVFRNLDSVVSEGGENFSTGEKQLLCMARAILKRSKVLVMDEATASVDYSTDELISKTIRHEFASSTILTIAHRLRTVIDYDRVMLLDAGHIVEFASPAELLSDPTSQFYKLCQATGKSEFMTLKQLADAKVPELKI